MILKETIDKIFDAAIIEEVVGEFVTLKKSGTSYKGLSPFTNEKTPSFFVVPHKSIYKCFSTGKGGNVVSFLMEHERMSYPEALRWLADKYGIEIEETEQTDEQKEQQSDRESLGVVNTFAQKFFTEQLLETEEGKAIGLSYFKERGYRDDIINKFLLGYSPDSWDAFTQEALDKEYQLKYLEKSGLTRTKNGSPFDFFKGRVMFPIRNVSGKVIAFGGRTLRSDKKVAKYYNSPESELYNKSRVLYGMYLAKHAILKEDRCYIVEGYTDVISLHQSEVENVVASAGTSLTEQQLKLIKRYTKNVTILFDGDSAGIKASFRGIDMILKGGMNVKVVLFPDGEDPDSFAMKSPSSEFQEYIHKEAKDFIVFKTDLLTKEAAGDPVKKAGLIHEIVNSVALIPDPIQRQVYTQECSRLLEIDETTLIREVNKALKQELKKKSGDPTIDIIPEPVPIRPVEDKSLNLKHQERDLIRLLLSYGQSSIRISGQDESGEEKEHELTVSEYLIHEMDSDRITLDNPILNQILHEYSEHLDRDEFPNDRYFTTHSNHELSELCADLIASQYEISPNWEAKHKIYPETEDMKLEKAVRDIVFRIKLRKVQMMIREINEQLKDKSLEDEQLMVLMKKRVKLDAAKQSLSSNFGSVIIG